MVVRYKGLYITSRFHWVRAEKGGILAKAGGHVFVELFFSKYTTPDLSEGFGMSPWAGFWPALWSGT